MGISASSRRCRDIRKLGFFTAFLIAGCSVTPEPIPDDKRAARVKSDFKMITAASYIPDGPLTLHQAMARAIALNLPQKIKKIETDIAQAELEQSNFAMLPVLDTGVSGSTSNVQTSRTADKTIRGVNAGLTWNALDLGVSYARAHQNADAVLIARENERKALQDIMRDVRTAYWRVVTAETMMVKVRAAIPQLRNAVARSRELDRDRLQDVRVGAAYRRELIDAARQVITMKRELDQSRAELAEMLRIKPGTDFILASSGGQRTELALPMSLAEMEQYALLNRPEIRIESYNERISEWQAKEAFYKMLPGLELNASRNYSSDSALLNTSWIGTAMNLSMNLFGLFSTNAEKETAEHREELARKKRLAVSLAVLTQVHVAYSKFQMSQQQLRLAKESANSDHQLLQLVRSDTTLESTNYLEIVRLITRKFRSDIDEQGAYTSSVEAHGELMHAIGFDALPDDIKTDDMASLTGAVQKVMAKWETRTPRLRPLHQSGIYRLIDGILERAEPDETLLQASAGSFPTHRKKPVPRENDMARIAAIAPTAGTATPDYQATRPLKPLRQPQTKTQLPQPNSVVTQDKQESRKLTALTSASTNAVVSTYSVQLAAFSTMDRATKFVAQLRKEQHNSDLIWVMNSPSSARKTVHRVYLGRFADRKSANSRCKLYRSAGRTCYVRALEKG